LLRVGVAGLGRMGKLHFLNALRNKDINVIAIADARRSNQKVAEKYNVKIYDDYKRLIESEDLDAIIVSLPNFLKKESVTCAAEKDLAIFVDKPLARNFSEAKEIVKIVKTKNVPLMVGVNYRYFDSVQKVRSIMDQGRVGDIVIATSELIMDGPFSHSYIPRPVPGWWLDKEKAGGGALLDLGYHLIDLFNLMFGNMEIEFSILGYRYGLPIEDSATVVLRSPKTNTRCIINVGWFSKTVFPNFNFRINLHGTVGYVSTDHFAPKNLYFHAVKEGILNLSRKIFGRRIHYLSYTYYYASFAEILNRFFEIIKNDAELPVSLEEQVAVIKAIESVYKQNEVSNCPK
jgi:myo-inositol 2-dehydrogenase/D-chiro-inositol 1-dehydrogenase